MVLTIQQALQRASELKAVSDSYRLDTELLLAEALSQTREYLHTWPERSIAPEQERLFGQLFARRVNGEPLAYILGRKDFWDFQLLVNDSVLIPRPETELLVETAIELMRAQADPKIHIVDLGTGSGAIAIALARELPAGKVTAVDRSADALHVAQLNAQRLAVSNIEFCEGSWCDKLADNSAEVIVANPPYVALDDPHLQQGDLRFEPDMALAAGDEGLADIKLIVQQATRVLRNRGWLLIEHGYNQGRQVAALFGASGYQQVASKTDYAGLDRLTVGQWVFA